jgi:hypothetical protein
MKRLVFYFTALVLFTTSCQNGIDFNPKEQSNQPIKPLSPAEINAEIRNQVEHTGTFNWKNASDLMIWSAAINGDSILSIGYGTAEFDELKSQATLQAKQNIVDKVIALEKGSGINVSAKNIVIADGDILNYVDLKITDLNTVTKLRQGGNIRYIEPVGYSYSAHENLEKSSSGCSQEGETINSSDFRLIAPNCYVSWAYDRANIPSAWNYSTGQGVTVGLVDTGISQAQSLLNANFNDGYSSGRTRYVYGTYVDSIWPWVTTTDGPWDKCSHGTSMAGNISSPRNNDYQPVGVAYNCNLVAYRATSDVVLDGYHEQQGVADALKALGNRSDVRIISMSVGYIYSIGKISDAVKYAYSKGKLIFAAGGTSLTWTTWFGVIFPASMAETVAVTGVTDGASYETCDVCHDGDKIDFTVVMQRDWDASRTSPTLGFTDGTRQYVGGSSIATSTMAGMAALVLQRYPSYTRDQLFQKLKEASEFYPSRNSTWGYGNVDALRAVL